MFKMLKNQSGEAILAAIAVGMIWGMLASAIYYHGHRVELAEKVSAETTVTSTP